MLANPCSSRYGARGSSPASASMEWRRSRLSFSKLMSNSTTSLSAIPFILQSSYSTISCNATRNTYLTYFTLLFLTGRFLVRASFLDHEAAALGRRVVILDALAGKVVVAQTPEGV